MGNQLTPPKGSNPERRRSREDGETAPSEDAQRAGRASRKGYRQALAEATGYRKEEHMKVNRSEFDRWMVEELRRADRELAELMHKAELEKLLERIAELEAERDELKRKLNEQ